MSGKKIHHYCCHLCRERFSREENGKSLTCPRCGGGQLVRVWSEEVAHSSKA